MPFYCTTRDIVGADGQTILISTVIEIDGDKQFILKAKWSSKVKGPKTHIEYWYHVRRITISKEHEDQYLIAFTIEADKLRLKKDQR
jgi:hypothetical protein